MMFKAQANVRWADEDEGHADREVDVMREGDCWSPPPSRESTLIAENIVREWRPPLDQAAVPLVLAIAAALDEAIHDE